MAIICPTVTASKPQEYRQQLERVKPFAKRVHLDLADGVFAPVKLIDLKHIWWPENMIVDMHLMYESVTPFVKELIKLKPHLVIVHAESVGNFYEVTKPLKDHGISVGVALLQNTPVQKIAPALSDIDHVLIFSGDLGHFGGQVDLALLSKVEELRAIKPELEIGWDGGINEQNAKQLAEGGIDVLNVGGGIQRAADPAKAYAKLVNITGE